MGRNKLCMEYFTKMYSFKDMIKTMERPYVPDEIKANIVRLTAHLYIDVEPFTVMRLFRCYKIYESQFNTPDECSLIRDYAKSEVIDSFEKLFNCYKDQFKAYEGDDRKSHEISALEYELIRSCKFLLKYGIATYRSGDYNDCDLKVIMAFA